MALISSKKPMRIKSIIQFILIGFCSTFLTSCNNRDDGNIQSNEKITNKNLSNSSLIRKMNVAYNAENYLKALNYLNILIIRDSTNGEYYFKKGYCESGLFNTKKSTDAYKKAIVYNYRIVDANFNIGTNYILESDSIAKLYFEKSLAIDSNYIPAKTQLFLIKKYKKHK